MTGRASSLEKAVPLISNGSLPEEAEEESEEKLAWLTQVYLKRRLNQTG